MQNGQLTIENVDGELTVAATNGSITGHGISGRLTANVVNAGSPSIWHRSAGMCS
jgi:hypothetical protein